jgi:hypothetical protein
MPFVKHFVRMITPEQLDDDDVVEFYDIVQSHVPTKLVSAFTDDEEVVAVEVTHYESDDDRNIYEIVLKEQMSESEGMNVAQELSDEFDFDYDIESSMEV